MPQQINLSVQFADADNFDTLAHVLRGLFDVTVELAWREGVTRDLWDRSNLVVVSHVDENGDLWAYEADRNGAPIGSATTVPLDLVKTITVI